MAASLALWGYEFVNLLCLDKIRNGLFINAPLALDNAQRVVDVLKGVEEGDLSLVWNFVEGLHAVLEVDLCFTLEVKVKAERTHFVVNYPLRNVHNFQFR